MVFSGKAKGTSVMPGCTVITEGTLSAGGSQSSVTSEGVGLLEVKTGKVYTVILPAPGLAAHTEKTVRVEGMIHSGSLLAPTGMKVKDGSAWKAVVLPKAM